MSKEDNTDQTISSVLMPPDFDMSEEELFLLQKTYDPRLYLSPDDPRLVQAQPSIEPARPWREQDGVIYFSVTSRGMTGEQWIIHFEANSFRVSDYAKQLLRSADFVPTSGVTYHIAILKGELFADNNRITSKIRAEATNHNFTTPNTEIVCLIREKFSDTEIEAMGLRWIVVMHEPIKDSGGDPGLLSASRYDDGRWLDAYDDWPDYGWLRDCGFVFVASQASSQS